MVRRLFLCTFALLLACALPGPATAQDDDRSLIVGFLEDQLSDASRQIRITGFQGALSSRATMEELTIADDDGVWLTLRGAVLDWNRAALFRGRVEINSLSAEEILLPRLPPPGATDSPPEAAAEPFRLPDLPVSIRIDALSVARVVLGAPVLGQPLEARLNGAVTLDDALSASLDLERTDGRLGEITLRAEYGEDPRPALALQLGFREGADGIAANALGIPGTPALDLRIAGDGPLADFGADIALSTDGQPRLTGDVRIGLDNPEQGTGDTRFSARIGGDISALLLPDAQAFFGPDVALQVSGTVPEAGGLNLDALDLRAASLSLGGSATLDADNRPERFDLTGRVFGAAGGRVTLPGSDLSLDGLDITATHDRAAGNGWQARIVANAPRLPDAGGADRVALNATGTIAPPGQPAAVTADLEFVAAGLALVDAALAQAVGTAVEGQARVQWTDGDPLLLDGLRLGGSDYTLALDGRAAIADRALTVAGEITADIEDLSRFSALAGQPLTGAITGTLNGGGDPLGGVFEAELDISGTGLSTGIAQADALIANGVRITGGAARGPQGLRLDDLSVQGDGLDLGLTGRIGPDTSDVTLSLILDAAERLVPQLPGRVALNGTAARTGEAPWALDLALDAPRGIAARINGTAGGAGSALTIDAGLPDLAPFVAALPGPARAQGDVTLDADGLWGARLRATLPKGISAGIDARAEGAGARIDYEAQLADVAAFAEGFPGAATITGTASSADMAAWDVTARALGPKGVQADVSARYDGAIAAQFRAAVIDVAQIVPAFPGALTLEGTLAQEEEGGAYLLDMDADGPLGVQATVAARLADALSAQVSASVADVGRLAPGLSGGLSLSGALRQQGDAYALDFDATGPGAAATQLRGAVTADGLARGLRVTGSAPLALANRLLEPRAVFGTARYDLSVDGPLAVSNVTGQITVGDGRLTLPTLGKALGDLGARVTLNGGAAQIDAGAGFSDGGRVSLTGRLALGTSLPANLSIGLLDMRLRDGAFYETALNGGLRIEGPLSGGARISGQIDLGPAEVRLAETGLSFGGAIPDGLRHINEPGVVRASRQRAGLLTRAERGGGGGGGGAAYPLDIVINAPGRIFLRGRGLDAEVGGRVTVRGTSAAPIPEGQFELLRGRLDLLGKRLTLDEGAVTLAGDLVPALSLVASVPGPDLTAFVTMSGTVTAPEITFTSQPELPQDEVLAQAFFGQSLSNLSALQAARLAGAIATLSGRGGGTLDRLRNSFGLADLDVTQDAGGNTQLSLGAYIGENAYTDVTTSSDGDTQVNLKIDLSESYTVKGSADSAGDTSVGIFFERDY